MRKGRPWGPALAAIAVGASLILISPQISFAASSRVFVSGPSGLIFDPGLPEAIALAQDGRLYALDETGNLSVYYPYFETLPNGSLSLAGYSTLNETLPVQGDTMTYAPDVGTLYIASTQTGNITAVSTAVSYTNGTVVTPPRIVANISMPYPTFLDCLEGSTLYLLDGYDSNTGNVNITEINTGTNTVTATVGIPLGASFYGISCASLGGLVFLSGYNGVAMVNVTAETSTWIFSGSPCCGPTLFDQANGLLYVAQGDNIIALEPHTDTIVANITLPSGSSPFPLQLDPRDNLIFAGSMLDQVVVIDGDSNAVAAIIPTTGVIAPYPIGFALDPIQRVLYTDFLQGAIEVVSFTLENLETQTVATTATTTVPVTTTQTIRAIVFATSVASFTVTETTTSSWSSVATVTTSTPALGTFAVLGTLGSLAALVVVETIYILLRRQRRP